MPNVLTAFTPELWSKKGVAILREKIVMPGLIRVDFSPELAQAGDTVNTRKPAKMTHGDVPTDGSDLTVQDVSAANIPVTLTQHKHATFRISDREATRSFMNLVDQYLDPAMLALANVLDIDCLSLYTDVVTTSSLASHLAWKNTVNDARTKMNKNMVPDDNRRLVLSNDDEGGLTNLDLFVQANTKGDTVTQRTGAVGQFKGFDIFRASNVIGVGSPAVRKNLAFHRDAFTLVTRVPATAAGVTPGALQQVATDPDAGLSIRTTISYNPNKLATQVTCDILYGVKTLDHLLACVINASA
jgi:hypothetical protein